MQKKKRHTSKLTKRNVEKKRQDNQIDENSIDKITSSPDSETHPSKETYGSLNMFNVCPTISHTRLFLMTIRKKNRPTTTRDFGFRRSVSM